MICHCSVKCVVVVFVVCLFFNAVVLCIPYTVPLMNVHCMCMCALTEVVLHTFWALKMPSPNSI